VDDHAVVIRHPATLVIAVHDNGSLLISVP
jgi:hypothetical protein